MERKCLEAILCRWLPEAESIEFNKEIKEATVGSSGRSDHGFASFLRSFINWNFVMEK